MSNKIKVVATSVILSATVFGGSVSADDSEVFFGMANSDVDAIPNVLLVLDTAGSMSQSDPGESDKRFTRMKTALLEVLDSLTNVNVGFAEYTGGSDGDPILYPVTYIDELLCGDSGCGDVSLSYPIVSSSDDASEFLFGGTGVSLDEMSLDSGFYDASGASVIGLRFADIMIPAGATITSAKLSYTATDVALPDSVMVIYGHDTDDTETFTSTAGSLSSAVKTSEVGVWNSSRWAANSSHESADIKNIVQEIVDRPGWCGGNAMGFSLYSGNDRELVSFDADPERVPTLSISYNTAAIPADAGCIRNTVVAQVSGSENDAEQNLKKNSVNIGSTDLQLPKDNNEQLVGVRFSGVALPAGAEIESAKLELVIDEYQSGSVSLSIWGENTDDASAFESKKWNISNRAKTLSNVVWNEVDSAPIDGRIVSPDLKSVVQEVVDRSGWASGNSLAFIIGSYAGDGSRTVEAYDGEASAAPALKVTYISQVKAGGSVLTARDEMKQIVSNLKQGGGTEIVNTLYEASNYYSGNPVDLHGGGVQYPLPSQSSCQSNHVVFLTDGGPTNNSTAGEVVSYIGKENCLFSGKGECGPDLAQWMDENDHTDVFEGAQTVSTHTIGMALAHASDISYLKMLASYGGGDYYNATSAEELVVAYKSIFSHVADVETSFVSPGATVNQFNRLTHRDDIYFSLFKPKKTTRWHGNLKKYKLKLDPNSGVVRIFDNTGLSPDSNQLAVDPNTGFFKDNIRSFWSDEVDGNVVAKGGAASNIKLVDQTSGQSRKVFTDSGSISRTNVDLTASSNALHENNSVLLTKSALGIEDESDSYHSNLLRWARGVDVDDEDGDADYTDIRKHMGDPMHSRPIIVNYSDSRGNLTSTVYVGTNEGFVHGFDHENAEEAFAYIPHELLGNLDAFYRNSSAVKHQYGLDGTLSLRIVESDDDNIVDSGEEALLYIGMRRGGRNYYALNVTDRAAPKLKWMIKGGSGGTAGFEELGQSWSTMVPTTIKSGGLKRDVLLFAGGYDTNQDANTDGSANVRTVDSMGRAVFIVDADTGEKLWTGSGVSSGTGTGTHKYFPEMQYSIPSDLRVVDINFDGLADQFYVGDMGGQIWRFDIDNSSTSGVNVNGGVLASLAQDGDPSKARKFYYEPDISLITKAGKKYLSLAIGSGWRAHPLDEATSDRFYMMRFTDIYSAPDGYGKIVDPRATPVVYQPITEVDLVDISANVTTEVDISQDTGWMLALSDSGEKALSKSVTVNNQIIFTSYVPEHRANNCEAAIGGGNVYVLDIFSGSPTLDLNEDEGSELTVEDRSKELSHSGIAPEVAVLFTEEQPIMLVGSEQPLDEFDFGNLTVRTFWHHGDEDDMLTAVSEIEDR